MPSGKNRELLSRGRYWGAYDWTVPNERVRLVEMVQCRGCYEADLPDEYWDIVSVGSRASVRDAMRMGWRLGFVWESEPGSLDVELEGSLPAPEGAWACYYLRLRQTDGHRAWLSPVWLDA